MIPRFGPTYTYNDLFHCLKNRPIESVEEEIKFHLSNLCSVKHVFLLKSARVGLFTILKAYNHVGQALLPAYTCKSVPQAIHYAGYIPGFVDIGPNSFNVLPEMFEKSITPDTTAVLPTHLFGIPCVIEDILNIFIKKDILVIEDAAPAFGAEYKGKKVGCFGDVSVISFGGQKVLYGGAGGAILTNNDELAKKINNVLSNIEHRSNKWSGFVKALAYKVALEPVLYAVIRRIYAQLRKEKMYEVIPARLKQPKGYLSEMPEYACALVQSQLDKLGWNLSRRRKIASIYQEQMANHTGWILPEIPESAYPSWIQFPMFCEDKQGFYKHMKAEGVDTSWTYKYSCAESFDRTDCPNAHQAAKQIISLPTTPFITDQQAYQICSKALKYQNRI
jgi:perosamine synthetase